MKTLNIILYILYLIAFTGLKAQSFEGMIEYRVLNGEIVRTLFFKNDKCRSELIIHNDESPVYSIITNDQYYMIDEKNKIIVIDTTYHSGSTSNIIKLKKKNKVLGYNCSVYKESRETSFGKDTYFRIVADSLYTKVKDIGLAVNGKIILKRIQKTENGSYETVATKIRHLKLDDYLFELPDYPIRKVNMEKMATPVLIESGHK